MRSVFIASGFAALAALAAVNSALGQRVRGTLSDSATHEPIPGAVVSVSDSSGRFLARGVADVEGRFSIPRFDGSTKIHVIRIGYRPIDAMVPPGDEPLQLRMTAIASQLAVTRTSGRRVCPGDAGNSQALDLWEQARSGFFASIVARQAQPPTLTLRFYRLERDPVLRRIDDDTVWTKSAVGDDSFIAARTASAFASAGYMRERPSGEREYFAPDEAVLLDPAFAGAHCLRVTSDDRTHPSQIGIAFDPFEAEHDDVVDVRGTVWLDRKDLNLRTLDFEYTNVERVKGGSGGNITFELMPSGVPMIVRWMIHSPLIATESEMNAAGVRRSLPPRPSRTGFRVLGYQETGGAVRWAIWPGGLAWTPRQPAVTGLIVDRQGVAQRGIRAWLRFGADTAVSDSLGVFRIPRPLLAGTYTLVAGDSGMAAAGINQTVPERIAVSDDLYPTADVEADVLRLYSRPEALRAACGEGSYAKGLGVAMVRVVDSTGSYVIGAQVDVETTQKVVAGDTLVRPVHRSGVSGLDGQFIVCGAALDQPMTFRASFHDFRGEATIAKWTDEVMALPITIRPGRP